MNTFKRSWLLFRSSLQVMNQNRKLLLFPLITTIASIIIVLFFLAPAVWHSAVGGRELVYFDNTPQHQWHLTPVGYVCAAVLYMIAMFVATFCNVAFYSQIMSALSGEAASVGAGFAFAKTRIRSIIIWSLFAGAIGILISTLERRFGWVGRIVLRIIGMVWSVASSFAIPVIISEEDSNPIHILKNSADTIKKTWGELLVGYVGIRLGGLVILVLMVPLIVVFTFFTTFIHSTVSPLILISGITLWMLVIFSVSYLTSVANDIFRCALYLYASKGIVTPAYSADVMNSAWKTKKKK